MEIRQIQVGDDADFAAWFGVRDAADRHDVPDQPRWLKREQKVRHEDSDYRTKVLWLAEADGMAVGAAALALSLRDNPNTGMLDVAVLPEVRRRGIGTALLRHAEKYAEAAGRSSLIAFICGRLGEESTPGTAFAERHGFTSRVADVMRVLRAPFALGRIAGVERAALPHAESRLGLLMKIANLRAMLADRPAVKAVVTWNAGVNRHMISVNEQLGFVEHGWAAEFQR